MKIEFIEAYQKLSDMMTGDIAVSKDRTKFFVCGYYWDAATKENKKVILDINNLCDQYSDNRDINQPIKILDSGDKFICSR